MVNRNIAMPVLFALLLLLQPFCLLAQKNQKERLQNQKKQLEQEIQKTSRLLEETQRNARATIQELQLLDNQIKNQQSLISLIQSEIQQLNKEIQALTSDIQKLEKEIQSLKKEYAQLIYHTYLTRNNTMKLMYIFAAENLSKSFQRYIYLQEYASARKRYAETIRLRQSSLQKKLSELEALRSQKFQLLHEQERQMSILNQQKNRKNQLVQKLQQDEKRLRSEIARKQKEAADLQRRIEEIIRKEIEAARKRERTTTLPGSAIPLTEAELEISKGFAGNKGKLPWPVKEGIVIATFGEQPHPVISTIKIKNNGIDIATAQNTPVTPVFEGVVSSIITLPNSLKAVIIRHADYLTVYANLNNVRVKKGDKVITSTVIGNVGTDHTSGTSSLHFEIWREKNLEDPMQWLIRK